MPVPKFLQTYLASYDVAKLNKDDPSVASEVITSVLNLGDDKAVAWIFDNYPLDKIKEVVRKPRRGVWSEESLNYWGEILGVGQISGYKKALFDINPG